MARTSKSLPFDEAREFIREQCFQSVTQYQEWHKLNKPKKIPRYPNRVYKEWAGWNDWLGNNNEFYGAKRTAWRPYAEAIIWVHKLGLTKHDEWFEYFKANKDNMPKDIPSRPDLVYEDWRSWAHWLGNKPKEKVEAQQEAIKESTIFYVIQEPDYYKDGTVFTFGVERGGVSALRDKWNTQKFRVVKIFRFEQEQMQHVHNVISAMSTPYYGAENIRIVPNINQLCWEIGSFLDFVRV